MTQVDKNGNGTTTYCVAIQLDPGETLTSGASKTVADFVIVSITSMVWSTAR
jgi:hypothetical protein